MNVFIPLVEHMDGNMICSIATLMNRPRPFQILFFFFLHISIKPYLSVSATNECLSHGSKLSVERSGDDILFSPDKTFSAGFQSVGDNAYCFAIWHTKSANFIPVWMANRDVPVNGRRSALSLRRDGNLVLTDAGRSIVWETNTISTPPVHLCLSNTGNLMLQNSTNILWKSFDFPTNTLLPEQQLTRNTKLISSKSQSNHSSGFYSFYFDNDNVLLLLYDGPEISSVYWPDPKRIRWDNGRTTYNNSRIATLNASGHFESSDNFKFIASDYGSGIKRRLTIDYDGNLRLYSLDEENGSWGISWLANSRLCNIHGLCGPNSICISAPKIERRCSCPPGFKHKDPTDWSQGCLPTFNLSWDPLDSKFITIPNTEFQGFEFRLDDDSHLNVTLQKCKEICLNLSNCKAFMYRMDGQGKCFPKGLLFNGYRASSTKDTMHIKVPRNVTISDVNQLQTTAMKCDPKIREELARMYGRNQNNVPFLLWFAIAIGIVELICIVTGWWYMYMKNSGPSAIEQGYMIAATGFKRFSYAELKKATRNFREEIGRGGGGVVYKGELADKRVAAVKRLEGVNQGEVEFLAEVSTIGRINHMNLIQVWGFCAERKHRLLVYEYMEHGSLANKLSSNALSWEKRFEIALATAKGLAYLHEECLEWVLHCDVKPQNILLDADYNPKLADFGLSKLLDRSRSLNNSSFSRIRGTRGYMAPEWILNQPITSKVDVYSYGIVMLEMITGKSSTGYKVGGGEDYGNLVTWVRKMTCGANTKLAKMEEIMDPNIEATYDDVVKMELVATVALECVKEDRDARPTMRQVVEMFLRQQYDY